MAKKANKENNDLELLESPEALAEQLSKGEEFLKSNSNLLTYIVVGLLLVIGGGFWFFKINLPEKEQLAQTEMFQAQFYFEADSLNKALNGDGVNEGFLYIIDEYSMTDAANISNFYAGVCYMKKGEFETALEYLKAFSSSDLLIQARAYSLIGDANMELNNVGDAISAYKKASNYKPNKYFTPMYIMKLALAFETNKDYKGAVEAYNKLLEEFPEAEEANDAKKYKALAEGLASK